MCWQWLLLVQFEFLFTTFHLHSLPGSLIADKAIQHGNSFSMSCLAGGDISYHLEKHGKFQVERVRLYIAEVALGLEYLRSKRIIHRDIKPANMLLDSQGHVHVTDFNVATIVRSNVPVTSTTGTKPYMGMHR